MKTRFKIGGGIIIFAAFVLLGGHKYIDFSICLPWLFGAFAHEMGHFFAARLCGAKIDRMTIDVIGATMSISGKMISYGEEIFIAAAGPCVNIILAGLLFPFLGEFSVLSVMLGLLNLIPAPGFDGYRILHSAIEFCFGELRAEKVMRFFAFFAVFFMWLMAVYALLRYRASFSLFILSCALFARLFVNGDLK